MAASSSALPSDSGDYFVSKPTEFIPVTPSTFGDMISFVKDLHNSDSFSDLTIHCRGETFAAHKLILASRSVFFRNKLKLDQEMSDLTLDTDPGTLNSCMSYMYTGTAEIIDHSAKNVADLSKILGLDELHRDCVRHSINKLDVNPNNCLHIYSTANDIQDDELIKKSFPIVLSSFATWRPSSSFKNLPQSCAAKILSHPELKVASPNQCLTSALTWVKADPSSRLDHLVSLIEHLPLRDMDQWFVRQTIEDEEILQGQPRASSLLNATFAQTKQSQQAIQHKPDQSVTKQQTRHCGVIMGVSQHVDAKYQDSTNYVYAVNSVSGSIKKITTIPSRVHDHGWIACCMNGGVLYASGAGEDRREVYSFDVMNETWRKFSELLTEREGHCMCVSDGRLFVLGGRDVAFTNLVRSVEMLVDESSEWRVSGQLQGSRCDNTVCCMLTTTDILVYGVWDEIRSTTLQVYDTRSQTVTQTLKTPSGWCSVYGVVLAHDHVIMLDEYNTYTVSLSSVYKSHSNDIHTASTYITPNTRCAVFLSEDNHHIILVGGEPRGKMSSHYAYKTSVRDIIQRSEAGWQRVTLGGYLGSSEVAGGAVCSGQIPLKLME